MLLEEAYIPTHRVINGASVTEYQMYDNQAGRLVVPKYVPYFWFKAHDEGKALSTKAKNHIP